MIHNPIPPFMQPPGQMNSINSELAPKETLYVSNLNDRINREDLKFALFFAFSQYGEIHKITLKKSNKMRGQAFVIFQTLTSSTNARAGLNGMVIFEKPMQIEFARTRSLIFEQIEGNFYAILPKDQKTLTKREQKALKRETKAAQKQQIILDPDANSILLAEDLPQIVTEEALLELFGQYPGLKSVQLIMTRKLAFIEYDNEELASVALRGLNGFLLTITAPLKLRYARKT